MRGHHPRIVSIQRGRRVLVSRKWSGKMKVECRSAWLLHVRAAPPLYASSWGSFEPLGSGAVLIDWHYRKDEPALSQADLPDENCVPGIG